MQLDNALAEHLPGAWVVLGRPMACNLRPRWRWAARIYEAILSRPQRMLRFIRNMIMTIAVSVLAVLIAWSIDLDTIRSWLPSKWDFSLKEAISINLSVSVGVFFAALSLAFLLQSHRPKTWLLSFGAVWCFFALFPNMGWVSRSHGASGLRLGAVVIWGPLAVIFSTLLAMRVAATINSLRTSRRNEA